MSVYGEEKIGLIAEILGRQPMETFAKWVDLQIVFQTCGEKQKRHKWTQAEDEVIKEGTSQRLSWVQIAAKLPLRNAKQCRDRYVLHLDPALNKEKWTLEEDTLIAQLYNQYGSKWSYIASQIPGRTDNAVKNRFHGCLAKQLHNKRIVYSSDALCMKLNHKQSVEEKTPVEKLLNKQLKQIRLEKLVEKYLQKSKPRKQVEQAHCISDSENSGVLGRVAETPAPNSGLVPLYHLHDNAFSGRVNQQALKAAPQPGVVMGDFQKRSIQMSASPKFIQVPLPK